MVTVVDRVRPPPRPRVRNRGKEKRDEEKRKRDAERQRRLENVEKSKNKKNFQIGDQTGLTNKQFQEAKGFLGFQNAQLTGPSSGTDPRVKEILAKQRALAPEGFKPQALTPEDIQENQAAAVREQAGVVQGQEFIEEAGFFDESAPTKVELNPEQKSVLEKTPFIGGTIAVLGEFLKEALPLRESDKNRIQPLLQDPETVRELAIQEIQRREIEKGLSIGEKFGSMIEGIPIIGSLVGKFAGGLIEDPESNTEEITSTIKLLAGRMSTLGEKIQSGKFGDPQEAFQQIVDADNRLIELETRLQLLILSSPALRLNADAIDNIEGEILKAREKIFIAKNAAAGGALGVAKDSSLFLDLQQNR